MATSTPAAIADERREKTERENHSPISIPFAFRPQVEKGLLNKKVQ
jgi:hypothetical protein